MQGVYVALGYAALQMACQVLQVFGLLAVNVAGQVEVVVVFGYFIQRYHTGVLGHVLAFVKHVDYFVQVLVAQAVFVTVFDEAAACV